MELRFDYVDLIALALASVLGAWYMYEKHWVANNIFGLAFSVNGIEMLSLDSYQVSRTCSTRLTLRWRMLITHRM